WVCSWRADFGPVVGVAVRELQLQRYLGLQYQLRRQLERGHRRLRCHMLQLRSHRIPRTIQIPLHGVRTAEEEGKEGLGAVCLVVAVVDPLVFSVHSSGLLCPAVWALLLSAV